MRIISGKLKGRPIDVPSNFKGRPTTDFARQGLFNTLYNLADLEDLQVLELFAGTGAFALECLSRGSASAVCVDAEALHVKYIDQNFKKYQLKDAHAIRSDVFKYLERCNGKFELIFADPPFDLKGIERLPELIFEKNLLHEDGLFILEHSKEHSFESHAHFLQVRKYSNVYFTFFR